MLEIELDEHIILLDDEDLELFNKYTRFNFPEINERGIY